MELISTKMYEALKAAGAPEEDARRGAAVLDELDTMITKLEADHRGTRYLVGLNIILTLVLGFRILFF